MKIEYTSENTDIFKPIFKSGLYAVIFIYFLVILIHSYSFFFSDKIFFSHNWRMKLSSIYLLIINY